MTFYLVSYLAPLAGVAQRKSPAFRRPVPGVRIPPLALVGGRMSVVSGWRSLVAHLPDAEDVGGSNPSPDTAGFYPSRLGSTPRRPTAVINIPR